MKFNSKRTIKISMLLIMLLGIVMSFGMTSVSKEKLMTDMRFEKLYKDVQNILMKSVSEYREYPNRVVTIEGKDYDLKYYKTLIFNNDHFRGGFERHIFMSDELIVSFTNDNKEWDSISFTVDDKRGKELSFSERIKIALDFAGKYIDTNGYVLKKSITEEDDIGNNLDLTFVKLQNGYETFDLFYVQIGYDGQISNFNRQNYGLFNGIVVPKIDDNLLKKTVSEYVQKKLGKSVEYKINDDETVVYLDENKVPFISVEIEIEKRWRADAVESGVDDKYWQRMNIPVYCDDVKASN